MSPNPTPLLFPDGCPVPDPNWPSTWPESQKIVNSVIFVFGIIMLIVGFGLFWRFHRHPFIIKRGFVGQTLCGISAFLQLIVIPLRDAVGRETFLCDGYMILSLLIVPLFVGPSFMRLVNFYLLWRQAQQQVCYSSSCRFASCKDLYKC